MNKKIISELEEIRKLVDKTRINILARGEAINKINALINTIEDQLPKEPAAPKKPAAKIPVKKS